jgi:hypothetical protein
VHRDRNTAVFLRNTATAYTVTTTVNIDGGRTEQREHCIRQIYSEHRDVDGVGGTPHRFNTVNHRVVTVLTLWFSTTVSSNNQLLVTKAAVVIDMCVLL